MEKDIYIIKQINNDNKLRYESRERIFLFISYQRNDEKGAKWLAKAREYHILYNNINVRNYGTL